MKQLLPLPIIGLWYIVFLSQLLLYDQMNEDFHIETAQRNFP